MSAVDAVLVSSETAIAAAPTAGTAADATSTVALSEHWEVQERHEGCFTGGKVHYAEATRRLCCLCSEELHLVDADTKAATRRINQEGDGILTFAMDKAGINACTSHRSGLLRHFKVADGTEPELIRSWKAHDQLVADVCFDATGSLVASGSMDRSVKVWDFTGYFCTHNFRGHAAIVTLVRFHPAKLQVVSVADTEVRLWDLNTSTCIAVMKDHMTSISSLCFANVKGNAFQLITGGRDQVVNVWRLDDKGTKPVKSLAVFESVEGVAAVPYGILGAALQAKLTKKGAAEPPAFLIATVGDKCELRLWNPLDSKCVLKRASPHASKGVFRQVHFLDQGSAQKLMTIGDDLNLIMWSLPDLKVAGHIMGQNEEIVHVQMIPKVESSTVLPPERFVVIANDEHPRVVNCHGFGASLLRGHTDIVISCDVSPDGRWIATGGKDQSIRIWSASLGICVCKLAGHAGAVSAVSFTKRLPKGGVASSAALAQDKLPMWLVTGSHDKTMKVWELPSPATLQEVGDAGTEASFIEKSKTTVVAHSKEVNDVVVSPNNKLIASGGHDKLVRIWQFPSGDLMGECKGHRRGIWSVAFSPTDQVIASASGDTTVRLWNLKDYTAIKAFQGHAAAVLRVCFLSSGMQLMTSSIDGLLKLWQIRTADCAATFEEHVGKVWCIDVVGDQMVSGGSDSKLCLWKDVSSDKEKERHDAKADAVMKDSKIGLLLQDGKIEEALTLALDLDRPGQMRQILMEHAMDVVGRSVSKGDDAADESDEVKSADLRRWVTALSEDRLGKLVDLLEQWNSNRKMASLAQMLMGLVLQTVPPSKMQKIEGMNATCGAFLSYGNRHMARVDTLLQKTFLFDLVLQSGTKLSAKEDESQEASEGALKRTMGVLLGDEEEEEDDNNGVANGGITARKIEQITSCPDEEENPKTSQKLNGGSRPKARKRRKLSA